MPGMVPTLTPPLSPTDAEPGRALDTREARIGEELRARAG
jgi:hypothetical protein